MEAVSYLKPIQASLIKVGMYVMIDEKTCEIISIVLSKTGKHGGMKACLTGRDIFTQDKHTHMCAGHTGMYEVETIRREYQVMAIYEQNEELVIDYMNENDEIEQLIGSLENKEIKELQDLSKTCEGKEEVAITMVSAIEGKEDCYSVVKKMVGMKKIVLK
jgi:translation elongation factor P/translation initiation factor 5A